MIRNVIFSLFFNFRVPRKITGSFYRNFVCNHEINKNMVILLRLSNTSLASSRVNLTSSGEGASSAVVGHPYKDHVTTKIPCGVTSVSLALHFFLLDWLKLNPNH